MTEATELKPCECGNDEVYMDRHTGGGKWFFAECGKCWHSSATFATEAEARDAWNTRAITQAGASLTAAQKAGPVLLEAAYREGWRDGMLSEIHNSTDDEDWAGSDTLVAIAQAQEPSNER